jgi:AcrR family transcriptional regulator
MVRTHAQSLADGSTAPKPRGDAFVAPVLEVCLQRLAEVGYAQLSIPDVADRAGVNKTSIYRRWRTKAQLVVAALMAAMHHARVPPDTGTLQGDLLALARQAADFMQSPAGKGMLRVLLAEEGNASLRAMAGAAFGKPGRHGPWLIIQRAVARGELPDKTDASLLLFTIAGAIMHRVFIEGQNVPDAYLRKLVDLSLHGVLRAR